MSYYHLNLADIKEMPVPAFWALFEQIPKLRAEDDLRLISALRGGQEYIDGLLTTLDGGDEAEFDRRAFDRFKQMMGR